MSGPHSSVRRATVDDLPVLRGLWQSERLGVHELEKRLTEFLVAARPDGVVTGTLGVQVSGTQAVLHSAAFPSLAQAAEALPALWDHALNLARTRGVTRLWLRGPVEDHWKEAGFIPAVGTVLKQLPAAAGSGGGWWTLPLRDEEAVRAVVEKELAVLEATRVQHAESMRRQTAFWKLLAWIIAGVFFAGTAWMLVEMFRRAPRRRR